MSSERAQALADQFAAAKNEMIATLEELSESQWQTKVTGEDRPVAVVAHHVAGALRAVSGWVRAVATGQQLPDTLTHEFIDQTNAVHAEKHPSPTQAEVLDLMRSNGAAAEAMIRGFSDEELDRTGSAPLFGEQPLAARTVIRHVLTKHITDHLRGIKATFGQ
ncbi:MAG TPA: DinB family protein [Ktedonobacterales bacterium]|jgi:hypothetical protein